MSHESRRAIGQRPLSLLVVLAAAVSLLTAVLALPASAIDDAAYYLPAPADTTLVVTQGNGQAAGRSLQQQFAYDFIAADEPERFPVVAARGGTVIGTRTGIRGGRCDEPIDGARPTCWRDVNYVLIDHGDGTSALYSHLKRGEPIVRRGEVVSVGQPIGTAGSSGWTDRVKLGFQVQATPTWNEVGSGGWFLTESLPVAFADEDVLAQQADGVPQSGAALVSGNPGAAFAPFHFRARPAALPALVPFVPGPGIEVDSAYQADSPDGYGISFAVPAEGPSVSAEPAASADLAVRPLFGGTLAYAGCAGGESASLGRIVAIESDVDGIGYLAVHGHLSDIAPALTEADPALAVPIMSPVDVIGAFGAAAPGGASEACPDADPSTSGLFVAILRDGVVSADGEIVSGTPVSPEPLVGKLGYEGFAWWGGPVAASQVTAEAGRPTARWNDRTPASGSHIPFGETVTLRARIRDISQIDQVRFRAYHPRWPQPGASDGLTSFDPSTSWRQLAVCPAPAAGSEGLGSFCEWDGDGQDARVTYVWDPRTTRPQASAPWQPAARRAMTRQDSRCVPVSLAVEVIDKAGHVHSDIDDLPRPSACDVQADAVADGARVIYLDPLVPPRAPATRGKVEDRGWPPVYEPDPLKGAIVWRDRSNNEEGFRIHARRHWLEPDCSVTKGPWKVVTEVAANKERYRPNHKQVQDMLPIPKRSLEAPGVMWYWEYAVSAFNEAGESTRSLVGGFLGGSEASCDLGVVPPPELEP